MTHPLLNQTYKIGYKFGEKTFYSPHHFGIDYILPAGSPVYAPITGRVEYFNGSQAGTAIYLKGNDGLIHRLMHLKERLVPDMTEVIEGDLIGKVGSTGMSTGPHLHYDVYNGKGLKIKNFIDPEIYLNSHSMKQELLDNYEKQSTERRLQIELVQKLDESIKRQSELRAQEKLLIDKL